MSGGIQPIRGFCHYRGSALSAGYEYVGAFGGEYHFHKFTLNYDDYRTLAEDLLDRKTVLGLHGFAGYIPGNSPFFERFYGGGIGSIRGFRFRGVGPRDGRGNDPIGGNFTFTGSVGAELSRLCRELTRRRLQRFWRR